MSLRTRQPRFVLASLAAALAATVVACATNPATGKKEFSLMSEAQEVQLGQEMDPQIKQEMGVYDDAELQRYVSGVGMRLAKASERPNLPWHFTVVDEPAVNAFALPGGYIYVTRGILAFLNDEEQLAGVLGHEIGHVTARHSAQQYTKATSAGVGLALLSIFVPESRSFQGLAENALGLLFLKHGRDDERQADRLGADYTAKTGWDPRGVAGMLRTLARLDEASGSRRGVPNFLSTHPAPAERVAGGPRVRAAEPGRRRHVRSRHRRSGVTSASWTASSSATARVTASFAATSSCIRICGSRLRSRKDGTCATAPPRWSPRRRTVRTTCC